MLYAVPGDAWAGVGAPDAGWEAIDGYSVIDCVISPCGHLADVPAALRVDWARAVTQVLEFVAAARASGDAVSLERGLKWKLCLHDVLLRGPRRGTRGAGRTHGELAARFQAWRDGDRSQLITWWAADRARAWLRVRSPRHRRQAEDDDRRVQRVLELVSEGEISRPMRLLHSLGVADVTEGVLEQLRAKHPRRTRPVPAVMPGGSAPRAVVHLTETFRSLRRRAGVACSGLPNEYLRALVGTFDDQVADRVMPCYDAFATAAANAELPDWFYHRLQACVVHTQTGLYFLQHFSTRSFSAYMPPLRTNNTALNS